MAKIFSESVEHAVAALQSWKNVIAFLQNAEGTGGEKFNQENEVPGTELELLWFDKRVLGTCNLIKSLEGVESDPAAPVPLAYIGQLNDASQKFKDTILEIAGAVEQAKDKGIASLTPINWVVVVNETNASLNFASHLQNLKGQAENLLSRFYQVAPIVGAAKFDAFTEAVREFSETAGIVRKDAKHIAKAKENGDKNLKEITAQKEQSVADRNAIADALEVANENLESIKQVNQSSQTENETVTAISTSAANLKIQIDAYETQFQVFQTELDDRNTAFEKWSQDVETLYGGLSEKDERIGEVIQRAEEMLKGATNAGLAGTFNATLSELEGKLKWAQGGFYVSIFLLLLSALPLALYLAMVTLDVGGLQSTTAQGQTTGLVGSLALSLKENGSHLSTTIALFLLMVPTVWLTKFSAARHHQLFQLKEHYQYKYSLAMAVDGFKKQAPDHADAIAAETFNRLLFNPADRLDGKAASDDHPSPLMNWLMNKLGFNAKGKSAE